MKTECELFPDSLQRKLFIKKKEKRNRDAYQIHDTVAFIKGILGLRMLLKNTLILCGSFSLNIKEICN